MGSGHIPEYQAHLFSKKKLKPGTITQRLAALRFFYLKTLKKAWSIAETPYPKKVLRLPTILSQEEVARLIDAARTPHQRILLMTLIESLVPTVTSWFAQRNVLAFDTKLFDRNDCLHNLRLVASSRVPRVR